MQSDSEVCTLTHSSPWPPKAATLGSQLSFWCLRGSLFNSFSSFWLKNLYQIYKITVRPPHPTLNCSIAFHCTLPKDSKINLSRSTNIFLLSKLQPHSHISVLERSLADPSFSPDSVNWVLLVLQIWLSWLPWWGQNPYCSPPNGGSFSGF